MDSEQVKSGKLWYDSHSVDRVNGRRIPRMVIEDVIASGEHYILIKARDFGETKGATDAFLKRHAADMLREHKSPSILKNLPLFDSSKKKEHILVLTKGTNLVKTVWVMNDRSLRKWFRNHKVELQSR